MILTITITHELIAEGEKGSCLVCPMALAAINAVIGTHFMFVGAFADKLRLQDMSKPGIYEIDLWYPEEGATFVREFDNEWEVQPISITLDTDTGIPVSTNS